MKAFKYCLIILITSLQLHALNPEPVFAQEGSDEVADTLGMAEEEADLENLNMWELVEQAGAIRYPIFAILIIGIFMISYKLMEFYLDSRKATKLRNTPFTDFSLDQIGKTLSRQPEHMLSVLMSKLMNVFQTNRNADYLHDEISNFAKFKQDSFNSFRNRIDFLSDTAGALGLLGTVWGMFMVFSSGTLERDAILAGMGLALMSTLLGLLVSIALNFSSTLTEGYFTKRLSKVTDKADELRFRLIELSESNGRTYIKPEKNDPENSENIKQIEKHGKNEENSSSERGILAEAFQSRNNRKKTTLQPSDESSVKPDQIEILSDLNKSYLAGDTIEEILISLISQKGNPVSDEEIEVVLQYPGKVNGKDGRSVIKTNSKGTAQFSWELSSKTGDQLAGIRCHKKEYHKVRKEIAVNVESAPPASIQLINNHQAATTGNKLPKPVMVIVKDEFGNPVPNATIQLEVSMGSGEFPDGKTTAEKKTDEEGKLIFGFKLGEEPGFNAVDVKVKNTNVTHKFQAVGQEVTV